MIPQCFYIYWLPWYFQVNYKNTMVLHW